MGILPMILVQGLKARGSAQRPFVQFKCQESRSGYPAGCWPEIRRRIHLRGVRIRTPARLCVDLAGQFGAFVPAVHPDVGPWIRKH